MTTTKRQLEARLSKMWARRPRGQAMVEYSLVSHFMLIGGSLLLLPVINQLLKAITTFYDSIYTVIQTAAI
jgi:Flp pilus assembly pilin Flp